MTLEEFVIKHGCVVPECEDFGGKAVTGEFGMVGLCNGHRALLAYMGRQRFERTQHIDLGLTSASLAEAHRQQYWKDLAPIAEAVRRRKA